MASTTRNVTDALLTVSTAIPTQNTNVNGTAIDLGQTSPWPVMDDVEVLVTLPAQASMTNGQTVTATLQDSADNSSFAAISALATIVQTGASSAGPAVTARVSLPSGVRRYLRINIASSATAGVSTAVSATLSLVF